MSARTLYRSVMSDNLRWDALELREGDIVISAPPKCGATWTQRLVSLLVFDGPHLPAPMAAVSPWLDLTARPIEEVVAALDAQEHRRFIKTHTPLDGLVLDDRVTYLGVGRDPRDAVISMVMNRDRMRALHEALAPPRGRWVPPDQARFGPPTPDPERGPLGVVTDWLEWPKSPPEGIVSLATILNHYSSVWARCHLPNVAAFHFADYQVDLAGELVGLGQVLGVELERSRAEQLAKHATLDVMAARTSELSPDLWRSHESFFRTGGRPEWRQIFTAAECERYRQRAAELVSPDVLAWAHEGRRARGVIDVVWA